MAITDVIIPQSPPKGGKYVFEVKLSGKGGSWILNAPSEVSYLHCIVLIEFYYFNRKLILVYKQQSCSTKNACCLLSYFSNIFTE